MENIDFVLWMVLYPLGCSAASYLSSKERALMNKEPYTDGNKATVALINLIIWIVIGVILYS